MLKLVEGRKETAAIQAQFVRELRSYPYERIAATIGFPGGNYDTTVHWFDRPGFWSASERIPGSRYWNAFGLTKPKSGGNVSITAEINIPLSGVDKRVGAFFARDLSGSLVVAHRGKIGGGKKGVGKSLFLDAYRGEWEALAEDGDETKVALIAALSSPRLGLQIHSFLREVERIKDSIPGTPVAQRALHKVRPLFSEEFSGKKKFRVAPAVEASCDHGLIVNTLADALTAKGVEVANDGYRDLFVLDRRGQVRLLFEIKTEMSTESIYCGIGQLLFHGVVAKRRSTLVLVLPERPSEQVRKKLSALGMSVLVYRLDGDRVRFPSLNAYI
jgi:hypothetical protein